MADGHEHHHQGPPPRASSKTAAKKKGAHTPLTHGPKPMNDAMTQRLDIPKLSSTLYVVAQVAGATPNVKHTSASPKGNAGHSAPKHDGQARKCSP